MPIQAYFLLDSFFQELLSSIHQHIFSYTFAITLFLIDAQSSTYDYCSTGYGLLLQADQNGTLSMIQADRLQGHYTVHDRFLLVGSNENKKFFQESFQETLSLPPQKQVDTIVRKIQIRHNLIEGQPLLLFSIKNRKEINFEK